MSWDRLGKPDSMVPQDGHRRNPVCLEAAGQRDKYNAGSSEERVAWASQENAKLGLSSNSGISVGNGGFGTVPKRFSTTRGLLGKSAIACTGLAGRFEQSSRVTRTTLYVTNQIGLKSLDRKAKASCSNRPGP